MLLLYLASTLVHSFPEGKAKRVFESLDHSFIYVFIAGTYTPILFHIVQGKLGWVLFGIVFMWQMPHFLAIAWMYRDEYARAGMPLLPVIEPDGRSTGRQAVLYTAALIPVSMLPTGVGLATAHSRMEGLRRQCATQIVALNGQALGFTVSMGVASFPHTAHTEDELLKAADTALQEARRRGGNHVTLASIRFGSA